MSSHRPSHPSLILKRKHTTSSTIVAFGITPLEWVLTQKVFRLENQKMILKKRLRARWPCMKGTLCVEADPNVCWKGFEGEWSVSSAVKDHFNFLWVIALQLCSTAHHLTSLIIKDICGGVWSFGYTSLISVIYITCGSWCDNRFSILI